MEERRNSGRLLWGVVLVLLGLLFLSGNFGYGTWFWDRWWPLILIAIGIVMLYRRRERESTAPTTMSPTMMSPTPMSPTPMSPTTPAAQSPAGGPEPVTPPAVARRSFPTGAVILIGIGVAFLLEDVIGGSAFPALVLIAIGIAVILRERAAR